MADRITNEQRSRNMAAVRSRGNATTELALVQIFRRHHLNGWRRNKKIASIRPDFVFQKKQIVIFAHGCFWHGCRWHGSIPASNKKFWQKKIGQNKERDRRVNQKLKNRGWRVFSIWEHEIAKSPASIPTKIKEFTYKHK